MYPQADPTGIPLSAGSMTTLPAPAAAGVVVAAGDDVGSAIATVDDFKLDPNDPAEPHVLLVSRLSS